MSRKIFGIIGVLAVLALMVVASVAIINNNNKVQQIKYKEVLEVYSSTDYSEINPDSIISASNINGGFPDKIIGTADARVIIYEYADYACSHCAEMNTTVKKIVEDYNGKVAVVFRSYLLSGYPNNVTAAAASNAAAIQGYWEKYRNLVFSDQATWFYLKGDQVPEYFTDLFVQASNGEGDVEKFQADMISEANLTKLAFDYAMGEKVELTGTPTFRINGEKVASSDLKDKIESLLAK